MNFTKTALAILLAASAAMNIFQGKRIAALEDADVVSPRPRLRRPQLPVGAVAPTLKARDLGGHPVTLDFVNRPKPVILYVFSPSCGWCRKNRGLIRSLAHRVQGRYDVLGLSLVSEGLGEYIKENALPFPVYSEISGDSIAAFGFGGTPETIVVSPRGQILERWTGAYLNGITKSAVEHFFSVTLIES